MLIHSERYIKAQERKNMIAYAIVLLAIMLICAYF